LRQTSFKKLTSILTFLEIILEEKVWDKSRRESNSAHFTSEPNFCQTAKKRAKCLLFENPADFDLKRVTNTPIGQFEKKIQ